MRTLVDIPAPQLEELAKLGKAKKVSRAAIIREAISSYLAGHKVEKKEKSDAFEKAFGLWKDLKIDSVEYQRKLRDEW